MALSNSIYLCGRIVQLPTRGDSRHGSGVSASVLVAFPTSKQVFTNGKWVTDDTVHHVTVYGQDAEFLLQWGYVGAKVQLEGTIKSHFAQNGSGMKTRITASQLEILSQKADYYEHRWGILLQETAQKMGQAPAQNYNQQPMQPAMQTAPAGAGNNSAPFMTGANYYGGGYQG